MKNQKRADSLFPPVVASGSRDSETLCWTPYRSFQQEHSGNTKALLRGKLFTMRGRAPSFCKRHTVVLVHRMNGKIDKITYLKVPCNSWRCPDCAPKLAWRVQVRIKEMIVLNDMKYFLSLTLDPKIIPSQYFGADNQTHKYITKLFNTFATNIRREQKDFRYIWVVEFQPISGLAHLHIAINTRLDINKVRAHWKSIGGGPQMKVELIRDLVGVAHYISKYLTKGVTASIGYLHHFERRYSYSRNCFQPVIDKAKPFYPDLSATGIREVLDQQNLMWVYNRLVIGNYTDGETVTI